MIFHSLTFASSRGKCFQHLIKVLKTEGEAQGFQPSRGTLRMFVNDKIMFDRYYCINSGNHCKNEENIAASYIFGLLAIIRTI